MSKRRANNEGTIYKRQDGRWCATVSLPDGRRKSYYGATREAVASKLVGGLKAVQDGQPLPQERLTVKAYLQDWLPGIQGQVKETTFERYTNIVQRRLVPALGHIPLARLTPQPLQKFYGELYAQGLAPRTIKLTHAVLTRSLTQAYRFGLIARRVTDLITPPRIPHRTMTPLTGEQARALIEAAEGERFAAFFDVALSTGMRVGELLGLRWRDVDLARGVLNIQHSLARIKGKLILTEPKTARARRQIALSPSTVAAIRQHRSQQSQERLRLGPAWSDHELVFCSKVGTPMNAGHLRTLVFVPLLKRAGLPRIRLHDLRHTAATLLLQQGVHAKIVSERLGHSSISMTLDLYSHVLPDMQDGAAAAMERVLGR